MLVGVLLAVVPTVILSSFVISEVSGILRKKAYHENTELLHGLQLSIHDDIGARKVDALTIARYPPIAGLYRSSKNNCVDPLDGSTTAQWEG